MSINKAILIGNVTKDPDIRISQERKEIATFNLATNEKWKDKQGNKKEKVEFHRVVVFPEGLVNLIKNYVKKGSKLYIEGKLQTRKWVDKQGVDYYTTEIVLNNFGATLQLLDSANRGRDEEINERPETQSESVSDFVDSEIPF